MGSMRFTSPANFNAAAPEWRQFFTVSGGYSELSFSSTQWSLQGTASSGLENYKVVFAGAFSRPSAGGVPNGNITGFAVYNASGVQLYEGDSFSQPAPLVVANPALLLDQLNVDRLSVQLTSGDDNFTGGAAYAFVAASPGSDVIIGGSGRTTIEFSDVNFGIVVDLSTTGFQNTGLGQLSLINVTGVYGTTYADRITGSAGDDWITGNGGADQIDGGAGNDSILSTGYNYNTPGFVAHGGSGNDSLRILGGGSLYGDEGDDILNVTNYGLGRGYYGGIGNVLDGGDGGDVFLGWEAGNILSGGAGNDTFRFSNSYLYNVGHSSIDGGDGYDALDFTSGIAFDNAALSIYLGGDVPSGSGTIDARGIEELRVSIALQADLTGWVVAPVYVYGGTENDIILGRGRGGLTIDGGGGSDYLSGAGGNDVITAGAGSDTLLGNDGHDRIKSGGGIDMVDGGADFDTLILGGTNLSYQVTSLDGRYYLFGENERIQFSNIEGFAFSDGLTSWPALADRVTEFDSLRYLASHPDLIQAFGDDTSAAAQHFVTHGFAEARTIDFDALAYGAASTDLAQAFGTDREALEHHYIDHGLSEGRPLGGFDSIAYLLSNPDLAGFTPDAAELHWLEHGADEGRVGDALFGRDQTSHGMFADRPVFDALERGNDRDWFVFGTLSGWSVDVQLSGTGSNALLGGQIELYGSDGRLLSSATGVQGQSDVALAFQSDTQQPGLYYLAIDGINEAIGNYGLSIFGTHDGGMFLL